MPYVTMYVRHEHGSGNTNLQHVYWEHIYSILNFVRWMTCFHIITKYLVNKHWALILTGSSGVNYIPNEHEDLNQHGIYNIIQDSAILQISRKFGGPALNTYWFVTLTSYSGNNHVLSKHGDLGQYHPYVKSSEIISCYSFPASLISQQSIPIESSCSTLPPKLVSACFFLRWW